MSNFFETISCLFLLLRMKGLDIQNKDLKQELAELKKGIQWKSKQLENKKIADMNFKAKFDLNKAAAAAALAKVLKFYSQF